MSAGEGPPDASFEALAPVLDRQRDRDLIGRESNDALCAHGRAYARVAGGRPARALDLGSGGGVPGLILAVDPWTETHITLLDASQRRCTYLELAVVDLGLAARVDVWWSRAEEAGRDAQRRGTYDVVVARSFGPPAAVAECAAPLLRTGGVLVVSEPPDGSGERWSRSGLARLGLGPAEVHAEVAGTFVRMEQVEPCPAGYPRRSGVPARKPLF